MPPDLHQRSVSSQLCMRQLLRTVRWSLPPGLRLPIERGVDRLVPLPRRLGSGYWGLRRFLQEAQWWDRERIEDWQTERLREVVRHAKASVPGYSLLYADAGVGPDDIRRPEDIRLLPTVDKVLLRDNLKDFTATDIPRRHMRYAATSGSTGIPFGFFRLRSSAWIERAFVDLGWERAGWQLGDRSAVLRGEHMTSEKTFWREDALNRELHLSSYHLNSTSCDQYIRRIEEYHAIALQAYPSMATWLSDLILEAGNAGASGFASYSWRPKTSGRGSCRRYSGPSRKRIFSVSTVTRSGRSWRLGASTAGTTTCGPSTGWPRSSGTAARKSQPERSARSSGPPSGRGQLRSSATGPRTRRARKAGVAISAGESVCSFRASKDESKMFWSAARARRFPFQPAACTTICFGMCASSSSSRIRWDACELRIIPNVAYTEHDAVSIERYMTGKLGSGFDLEVSYVRSIPKTPRGKACILDQRLAV